jgi:hypothetical protein
MSNVCASYKNQYLSLKSSTFWDTNLSSSCLIQAGFLLVFLYNPEDDSNMFLQNISWLSLDTQALYPTTQNSSKPLMSEYQILHNKHFSLNEYLA